VTLMFELTLLPSLRTAIPIAWAPSYDFLPGLLPASFRTRWPWQA
jgi:hypothetical protein